MMSQEHHYECAVRVDVAFLPEQSDIEQNRYAFAYHVTIVNTGDIAVQLISRHWIITEANEEQKEVKGLGVVGEQPLLNPNERYEYTSSTVIGTPMGQMQGSYQMVAEDGTQFDVMIPVFKLNMPRVLH